MGRIIEKLTYKGRVKRLVVDSIFIVLQIIMCVSVYIYINKIGILPNRYLKLLGLCMVASVLVAMILNMFKYIHILGKIISLLVCGAMLVIMFYGHHTMKMLNNISTDNYDVDTYIVVTKSDGSINSLHDLDNKTVGIISTMNNKDAMTNVIQALNEKGECTIVTKEYAGLGQLVNGLLSGGADAIIYNAALGDTISEAVEYYDTLVKVIDSVDVKTKIDEKPKTEEVTAPTVNNEPVETPTEEKSGEEETFADDLNTNTYVYDPSRDPNTPGGGGYIGGDNTVDNSAKGPITDRSFNILISGIDAYGSLAGRSRSDVNILVSVNPVTRQIVLTNTPRDYYVPIPGVTYGNWRDKLTHAGVYGVWSSVATIENIYNVQIDYYVRVNFTSFVNILNALGEIEVYSDYEFSTTGGYHFNQGYNTIKTGNEGLAFARERYSLPGGDHQRGRNQMALVEAMINKCLSPAILPNFIDIVNSVSNCVQTNMTVDEITSIVRKQLDNGGSWSISRQWVTGSGATRECFSMAGWELSVVIPDQSSIDACRNVINGVLN